MSTEEALIKVSFFLGSLVTERDQSQGVLGNEIAKGLQELAQRIENNQTILQHQHYTHIANANFLQNELGENKSRINLLEQMKVGAKGELEPHNETGSDAHLKVKISSIT
jgi:hypothetical protein